MHRLKQYIIVASLAFSLLVPIGSYTTLSAASHPDDRPHRYYDTVHKDYHEWTEQEQRAYKHWLEERREAYHDYAKLKRKEQKDYWNWRHDHPGEAWERH